MHIISKGALTPKNFANIDKPETEVPSPNSVLSP